MSTIPQSKALSWKEEGKENMVMRTWFMKFSIFNLKDPLSTNIDARKYFMKINADKCLYRVLWIKFYFLSIHLFFSGFLAVTLNISVFCFIWFRCLMFLYYMNRKHNSTFIKPVWNTNGKKKKKDGHQLTWVLAL